MSNSSNRVTTKTLLRMREKKEPITMLTAYDYPTAKMLDEAGVDCLLVGDSLAMVVQGHENTLPVTLDQMIYHAEMVARAARRALVIVDIPFPEGQIEIERTVNAAARILKETKASAVKLEGGAEQAMRIEAMVTAGIPVMAHVGLRPQTVHLQGGYRVERNFDRLVTDARAAEAAGAFSVLMECVPADAAKKVTEALRIPTIGIGAGPHADGQVLVLHDILGIHTGYLPRFVRSYGTIADEIKSAVEQYCEDVRQRRFPSDEHSFK